MSDDEVPRGDPSPAGPRPGTRHGPGGLAAPAAVSPTLDAGFVLGGSTASAADESLLVRYAHHAVTPIPWMVASLGLMAAAVWAVGWSEISAGASDPVRSSEWWSNIYSVLLPAHDLRLGSYSQFRMWIALAVLVVAALVIAGWIGRIGRNLRPGHAPFGAVLPIIALPAWWVLPVSLGMTTAGTRSRGDMLVRALLAFGLLFSQFLLLRWPLLNRIWRAGRFPYDVVSIVLWLPMLIPWSMFLLSTSVTWMLTSSGESPADSPWRPTDAMTDWARYLTHATEIGVLLLLIAVTVSQHLGIRADRSEERERRDAATASGPLAF